MKTVPGNIDAFIAPYIIYSRHRQINNNELQLVSLFKTFGE